MSLDYRAYPILYVDDEQQNLVSFQYAMEGYFTVLTARTGPDALKILAERDIAVLISDQRMPGMTGVEVCQRAREIRPQTIRMIMTAYADLHAAIDAINHGHVSRYLVKPWRNEDVIETLRTAIDLVHIQRTVQNMEMRLLRSGQSTAVTMVYEELLHEVSNPLGALDINASLITELLGSARQAANDPTRVLQLLETAAEAHADSVAAITQLKSLVTRSRQGRKSAAQPKGVSCDSGRVVDATVRIVRHEVERVGRIELVLESSPMVAIESSVLGQVVLNLVLNAAQALRAEAKQDNRITVKVREADDMAQIIVSDNGAGIAAEHLDRIFDPFFTTKDAGTGVGLAISRELITQAKGTIRATSEPGGGATFTITLPPAKA